MVALGDKLLEPLRALDREHDLDLAARKLAGQLEPERLEDAEHPPVLGQHQRDEALDPVAGGALGELLDETRPDPAALVSVRDRERRLGEGGVAQARVVRERDDPLGAVLDERPEKRPALGPVGLEHLLDDVRPERGEAVEAHVEALTGKGAEEVEDRVGVVARRRAEPQRAPVAEDHVDDVGHAGILPHGRHGGHGPTVPAAPGCVIGTGTETHSYVSAG